MRIAATLVGLLLTLGGPALAQPEELPEGGIPVDAEIVLAVDASRSMDLTEFEVQRDGYLQALRHPDLIRAVTAGRLGRVAIAYFEWSGQAQDGTLVPWRIIASPEDAAAMAAEIAGTDIRRGRGTSIARAISFATVLIEDGTVDGDRKVIDVSGDGTNNTGPPVTGARDEAVARGITINGLPVMLSANGIGSFAELDRYYEECVIGGEGAFVLVASNPDELARTIRRKLILEISGLVPEPRVIPADYQPMDCLIGEKQYRSRGIYFR
jgi:hypothetical protein